MLKRILEGNLVCLLNCQRLVGWFCYCFAIIFHVFFLKPEWLVAKAKLPIFSLTCVSKVMFLGFCGQSIGSCTVLNYNRKDVILIM